jgi:hypothetical protein
MAPVQWTVGLNEIAPGDKMSKGENKCQARKQVETLIHGTSARMQRNNTGDQGYVPGTCYLAKLAGVLEYRQF